MRVSPIVGIIYKCFDCGHELVANETGTFLFHRACKDIGVFTKNLVKIDCAYIGKRFHMPTIQLEEDKVKSYQERVVIEKEELDGNRQRLTTFIGGSDDYRALSAIEKSRLHRQLEAMTLYSNVLSERIEAFKH